MSLSHCDFRELEGLPEREAMHYSENDEIAALAVPESIRKKTLAASVWSTPEPVSGESCADRLMQRCQKLLGIR